MVSQCVCACVRVRREWFSFKYVYFRNLVLICIYGCAMVNEIKLNETVDISRIGDTWGTAATGQNLRGAGRVAPCCGPARRRKSGVREKLRAATWW